MPHYCRICIAAVLLTCLVPVAFAEAGEPTIGQRKEDAVRSALERIDTPIDAAAVIAAAAHAEALLSVSVIEDAGRPSLVLRTTSVPECNTFSLDGGRRLIIDLHDTVHLGGAQALDTATAPLVKGLHASLYACHPDFLTRVVLDLARPCAFSVREQDGAIQIELRAKGAGAVSALRGTILDGAVHAARGTETLRITIGPETPEPEARPAARAMLLDRLVAQLDSMVADPWDGAPIVTAAAKQAETRRPGEASLQAPQDRGAALDKPETPPMSAATLLAHLLPPVQAQPAPVKVASAKNTPSMTAPRRAQLSKLLEGLRTVATADVDIGVGYGVLDAATDGEIVDAALDTHGEIQASAAPQPRAQSDPNRTLPSTSIASQANTTVVREMRTILDNMAARESRLILAQNAPGEGVEIVDAQPVPATQASTAAPAAKPAPAYRGDPLNQPITLKLMDEKVSNIVALLAATAGINVIAGTDLSATVSVELTEVPLMQAMETTLRIVNLGIVEEKGVYHIIPYDDAIAAQRETVMVSLNNARAADVRTVLEELLVSSPDASYISISSHDKANTIIIAGPEAKIGIYVDLVRRLDITELVTATVTIPIKLNYAEPVALESLVSNLLTPDLGKVASDARGRYLIVTDVPIVVEQIRELVAQLDMPVKMVYIDAMIVDVKLSDEAKTGVDWLMESVRRQSGGSRAALNQGVTGSITSNLQEISLNTSNLNVGETAGLLNFGILSGDVNWRGIIQAEVRNTNSNLISQPQLLALENTTANITISQEIPYIELVSSEGGGQQTKITFKDIGTILSVTPRVTHDDHIIIHIVSKQSDTKEILNGVPIEDKRSLETTAMLNNGQTIFLGGLRAKNYDTTIRKVPILGDIPVLNLLFRQNVRGESVNELLIFLTCNVVKDELELTPYQEDVYNETRPLDTEVNAQRSLVHDMIHPGEMRDPLWEKWRRSE